MAIVETTYDENENSVFVVDPGGNDAVTLATANTYVDKNITFQIKSKSNITPLSQVISGQQTIEELYNLPDGLYYDDEAYYIYAIDDKFVLSGLLEKNGDSIKVYDLGIWIYGWNEDKKDFTRYYSMVEEGLEDSFIKKPSTNGINNQILATNGNGTTKWVNSPEQVTDAHINDLIDAKNFLTEETYKGTVTSVNGKAPVNGNVTLSIPTVTNDFTNIYKNRLDTLTDDYIRGLFVDGNEVAY